MGEISVFATTFLLAKKKIFVAELGALFYVVHNYINSTLAYIIIR
jgi:hypothetical protein